MAAALFRGRLCLRCIHSELCRVVWRPQAAQFSSKPSDRKQPRRTHIKKAKPQPAVDIATLLEHLFSQRRPGTAPPPGKDLDPVQRLFLEKIREYNNLRRLNQGLMEAEPDYVKTMSEETTKLQRLYGGGDLSSFPEFTFTEPEMDQDS
uniref:ATP synthase-coupling factor 6, mitochondrial-like isoform X2 n=1 Tax=Scatophagus argus TaxID=75038 RepID=UPI001ED84207|nr:ATP synthase-coupling factor 6, mitochondrial-like isoform X2 [Scatophagus argus]